MTLLAERRFMMALSGCPRRSQDYNQNLQTTFDFNDFLPEYEPTPFYREGLEGSEKRAREAARSDGFLLSYGSRPVDRYRINEQGKAGSAVGRNAGGRSGTLAPAANIKDLRGRRVTGRALNAEDQVMVSGIVGQP